MGCWGQEARGVDAESMDCSRGAEHVWCLLCTYSSGQLSVTALRWGVGVGLVKSASKIWSGLAALMRLVGGHV